MTPKISPVVPGLAESRQAARQLCCWGLRFYEPTAPETDAWTPHRRGLWLRVGAQRMSSFISSRISRQTRAMLRRVSLVAMTGTPPGSSTPVPESA